MRNQVDRVSRLPSLLDRELAIALVQDDQAVGRSRRGGNLGQAHRGMKQAAGPRFPDEPRSRIVQHTTIVEVLETVRSGHNRRVVKRAAHSRGDPQPFRAGDVDDIVWAGRLELSAHRRPGRDRAERLPQVGVRWMRANPVGQQYVAGVSERPELLLQLDWHLRGAKPRIRRVVADEEDPHRDQSSAADKGGQPDLSRR